MKERLRRTDGGTLMLGTVSLARSIAADAMFAAKLPDDFRLRDAIVMAIVDKLDRAVSQAIDGSVYARACESMARQLIHPKMTGRELAEQQLKGHAQ